MKNKGQADNGAIAVLVVALAFIVVILIASVACSMHLLDNTPAKGIVCDLIPNIINTISNIWP